MEIRTKKQLREEFFKTYPEISKKKITLAPGHTEYVCDTRCVFSDFVDQLEREGVITTDLAKTATL